MITKLFAVFNKEWRLLWRDKIGLIFLFILPMCLVLFITLTTSGSDPDKPRQLQLLLINQDQNGEISKGLVKALGKIDNFVISQSLPGSNIDAIATAQKTVAAGKYQALILIPPQLSSQITSKMQQQVRPLPGHIANPANIAIFFDPALPKNLQDQVTAAVQMLSQRIELQLWQQTVYQLLQQSKPPLDAQKTGIINVATDYIHTNNALSSAQPNDVQQNVPAWALFGMFFIITPLSGIIIKERRLGVLDRLSLAPVALPTLILGKIGAFICINLLQLALMLAVGVFILPLFGLPTLNVTAHLGGIFVVGLAASMAATGFGLLIGSLVKTPEQATVIGPFIIVILAAIGGIFVPVYLLPEGLKHIAQLSPMYWALQSFIDIFVRSAGISQLWPNLAKLLGFALVSMTLASLLLNHRRR